MRPIVVPSNRPPDRFYRGGARISAFRRELRDAPREPEDWIGSITAVHGAPALGLSRLPDGRLLRDAVADDPVSWLGAAHVRRWGADTRLLVKLLDAGQRLPVHAHPHDDFAGVHLGRAHGKAEAWFILQGGTVHLGLRRDVGADELAALVARQDATTLLGLLHAIDVVPGDVVWVPPGELHAIGADILLLELQQPEDLSILLEWEDYAIDGAALGHLGLGFEVALTAVNRQARRPETMGELVRTAPVAGSVFPAAADEYFRLERVPIAGETTLEAGFAVVIVAEGEVEIGGGSAAGGTSMLVPHAAGPLVVRGAGELLVARPPAP